jgi:hypothetical protein
MSIPFGDFGAIIGVGGSNIMRLQKLNRVTSVRLHEVTQLLTVKASKQVIADISCSARKKDNLDWS